MIHAEAFTESPHLVQQEQHRTPCFRRLGLELLIVSGAYTFPLKLAQTNETLLGKDLGPLLIPSRQLAPKHLDCDLNIFTLSAEVPPDAGFENCPEQCFAESCHDPQIQTM